MIDLMDWSSMTNSQKGFVKKICSADGMTKEQRDSVIRKLMFIRIFFQFEQGMKWGMNWHHYHVGDTMVRIINGEIQNLVFNQPPGSSKTELWSIGFPAMVSAVFERARILNISYSDGLVQENAVRVRSIMRSREYQEMFPCNLVGAKATNVKSNDSAERMKFQLLSRSMGGQITGVRGGLPIPGEYTGHIALDDPDKPEDVFSKKKVERNQRIATNTIMSRKQLPETPVIINQQRLSVNDISGFALAGKMGIDFDHIKIPALIGEDYIEQLPEEVKGMCWDMIKDTQYEIVSGEKLWSYWPMKEDITKLLRLWEVDEYTFLSQYMQNPKALTGGLIDTDWFERFYGELPPLKWRAVYVDTNSGKVNDFNDFTVFTLAGMGHDGRVYIIDVERGKWDPEELLQKAIELWDKWKVIGDNRQPAPLRYMSIEDKQAGQGLIQTLKNRRSIPVKAMPRGFDQNKLVRCMNTIPHIKSGSVVIPAMHTDSGEKIRSTKYWDGMPAGSTEWVPAALKECADFSHTDSHDYDDIVDTWFDAVQDMLIDSSVGMDYASWV